MKWLFFCPFPMCSPIITLGIIPISCYSHYNYFYADRDMVITVCLSGITASNNSNPFVLAHVANRTPISKAFLQSFGNSSLRLFAFFSGSNDVTTYLE